MQIKVEWSLVRIIQSECYVMLLAKNSIPPEQVEIPRMFFCLPQSSLLKGYYHNFHHFRVLFQPL
jgi:hypothetical protein